MLSRLTILPIKPHIYRLNTALVCHRIGINETLEGEDVIIGFKIAVSDIFDYHADPDPEPEPRKAVLK